MKKLLILALTLTMLICCLSVIASATPQDISKQALVNSNKRGIWNTSTQVTAPLRNIGNGLVGAGNASQTYISAGSVSLAGITAKCWVRYDFGALVTINSSEITWSSVAANVASDYYLAYSTDGVTWNTSTHITGNTNIVATYTHSPAITARYYAIIIMKPTQETAGTGDIRIDEVKIFGEPSDTLMNLTAGSTVSLSGSASSSATATNNTPIANLIDGFVSSGNDCGVYITGKSATAPLAVQKYSDGDAGTTLEWETGVKDWIQFDLGASYSVKQYKIFPHGTATQALKTFYVLTSTDGTTWTEADHVSNNTAFINGADITNFLTAPIEVTLDTPVNARYVAVAIIQQNSEASNVMRLQEIEILGSLPTKPPLATPAGLAWADNTATWTAVDNAVGYEVQFYNNGTAYGTPVTVTDPSCSITLAEPAAYSLTFTVKALADQINYNPSAVSAQSAARSVTVTDLASGKAVNSSYNDGQDAADSSSWKTTYNKENLTNGTKVMYIFNETIVTPERKDELQAAQFTGTTADGGYVEIDLGSVQKIGGYMYKYSGNTNYVMKGWLVITSEDGTNWTLADTKTGHTGIAEYYKSFSNVISARYIRYIVTQSSTDQFARLYGAYIFNADYAAKSSEQLGIAANRIWTGYVASWDAVANATSYTVGLYKNGTLVDTKTGLTALSQNFKTEILANGEGDYTFRVTAIGNGTTYVDGYISWVSAVYEHRVTAPAPATALTWTGRTASWTSGDVNTVNYDVVLYNSSDVVLKTYSGITATSIDLSVEIMRNGIGDYYFTVMSNGNGINAGNGTAATVSGNYTESVDFKVLSRQGGVIASAQIGCTTIAKLNDGDYNLDPYVATNRVIIGTKTATVLAEDKFGIGDTSIKSYVMYDLIAPQSIYAYDISFQPDVAYKPTDYYVFCSADNVTWTQLQHKTGTAENYESNVLGAPVDARYIAIGFVTSATASNLTEDNGLLYARIGEFGVFGVSLYSNVAFGGTVTSSFGYDTAAPAFSVLTDGNTAKSSANAPIFWFEDKKTTDPIFNAQFPNGLTEDHSIPAGDTVERGIFNGTADGYFQIDLGEVKWIDGYKLHNYVWGTQWYQLKTVNVYVSETGNDDWTLVDENVDIPLIGSDAVNNVIEGTFPLMRARYIRVSAMQVYVGGAVDGFNAIGAKCFRLYEVMVMGYQENPGMATQLSVPANRIWSGKVAQWDAVSGADHYSVRLYEDGVLKDTVDASTASYDFTSQMTSGKSYTYKVIAVDTSNTNTESAESWFSAPTSSDFYSLKINMTGNGTAESGTCVINGIDLSSTFSGAYTIDDTYALGTQVTVSITPAAGSTFKFWQDVNTGKVLSEEASYSFTVGLNTDIVAVVVPTEEGGIAQYTVVFEDFNQKVIQRNTVTQGTAVTPPAASSLGTYIGYSFTKWSSDAYNNVTSDLIIKALYTKYQVDNEYDVKVSYDGGATYETVGKYFFDTLCTLNVNTANLETGKVFGGWSFDGTTVVSYDETYSFYVAGETNIKALSVDAAPTAQPTISIMFASEAAGRVSFMSQRIFPTGTYTFVESGIIYTKNGASPMNLSDVNSSTVKSGATTNRSLNGQFMMNITSSLSGNVYARAYLIYKDSMGVSHTIYSSIASHMLTV